VIRVKEILEETSSERVVDFYVPVSVKTESYLRGEFHGLMSYEFVNSFFSMIEIGIDYKNGQLLFVTLVEVNSESKDTGCAELIDSLPVTGGALLVDTSPLQKAGLVKESLDFDVVRRDRKVYILFAGMSPCRRVSMGSVDLLVGDGGVLAGFVFSGFSDGEWEEMNEGIDFSVKNYSQQSEKSSMISDGIS
jgi:hypothetical protein